MTSVDTTQEITRAKQRGNNWNGLVMPGTISQGAAALDDPVFVTTKLLSDDGSESLRYGPCDWMPRAAILPQPGDPCRIAFDANRTPFIIWWKPAS